ncbi:uncharacterized protein LOC125662216 [Ostrea edulis]|uniref:uncharacterized protein LOC125662216 n=1 Tax=Ostrea edulis TaxID=37623 RepID=UPI0024AEFB39|nr:uncharacterized protein LOC125662216 [Ostrea edulis]
MDSRGSVLGFLLVIAAANSFAQGNVMQIVFTDEPTHITRGSEVHLTCLVTGGNDPHITWISPTGLLPLNAHMINDGRTLAFTNFDDSDNGQYICIASDGQQFANHIFNVRLNPAPLTTPSSLNTGPSTTTSSPHTTTHSPITHKPTHSHYHTTTVQRGPPHITSIVFKPPNYRYGDDVQLTCHVESHPAYDNLGWNMLTDPSRIPANVHLTQDTNSVTVEITNFQRQNEVKYQCYVQNSEGLTVKVVSARVPY